jgi:putative ABC transport system permease protein
METLLRDIRFGIRSLAKRPGPTSVALITLGLGIAINTAVFSAFDSVLLRPLPLNDPERLVSVWEHSPQFNAPQIELAPANFIDIRSQNQVFESIGAFGDQSFNLTGEGEPERLEGISVSANVLELLGVNAALGRTFFAGEDQPGEHRVVVLSHSLWQRRFNSDASLVGRNITLDGESFTVVGVMPKQFFFPARESELWVPMAMSAEEASGRGDHYLRVVARLRSGLTIQQANSDLSAIAKRLSSEYPRTNEGLGFLANSLQQDYVGNLRLPITILFAAVALVLCIACANIANLLLAQATTRRKEMAIRVALGARRWSIIRQLLIESLILAIVGGALGIITAIWGVEFLSRLVPNTLSQLHGVSLDARVLMFAVGVTLLTGVVFGTVPAIQASRTRPGDTLSDIGRDTAGGNRGRFARRLLVVTEVAVAVVLLVGAGLLMRSFQRLKRVDPGFSTENLLTMRMVLPTPKYAKPDTRRAFYDEVLRRVKELPGVENAGMISFLPLSFSGINFAFTIEGQSAPGDSNLPLAVYRVVSADYFSTMEIPLMRGRSFDGHDTQDSSAVIVINRQLAERFWPNEEPIGKRLKIGPADSPNPWATVVGVVGDVRQAGLYGDQKLEMYAPYNQDRRGFVAPRDLIVRTRSNPASFAAAVRESVWSVDKDQPVSNIKTMDQVLFGTVSRERFQTLLLTIFASLALVLACVGLYGVISFAVAQRTHEIGVRMALGARGGDVLKMVLNQGMTLTLIGIALGLISAFLATRLMSAMLYEVTATDPLTFLGVAGLLIVVAFLACFVPARRATKVDPLVALRYE